MPAFVCLPGATIRPGVTSNINACMLFLIEGSAAAASARAFYVGDPENEVPFERAMDDLIRVTAIRNPDFYEHDEASGRLVSVNN